MCPDNKVHGANTGPTWVLSAPDGPHVSLMNLVIWVVHALGWMPLSYSPGCNCIAESAHQMLLDEVPNTINDMDIVRTRVNLGDAFSCLYFAAVHENMLSGGNVGWCLLMHHEGSEDILFVFITWFTHSFIHVFIYSTKFIYALVFIWFSDTKTLNVRQSRIEPASLASCIPKNTTLNFW